MQPMGGMKQGDSMPMRGMMGSGSQPMGQTSSMPGGGGGMSGMSHGTTGMMSMMGKPPSDAMSGMAMPTALPGFPGASHLYHIGSTGFFLDHDEHITLTIEQQSALNAIKEKALLANANAQRKIDAAEQELWELTASDQPDAAKIEAKVQEIEKMRADPRLSFIRAVGEAAKVLTDQQRQSLLGQLPQHNHNSAATPAASRGKK
jgi:Spy/CpxP family protein refolding chaperone